MSSNVARITPVRPGNLVLWIGAGISADAPTNGPLGRTLTDRALDYYFAPGTRQCLNKLYADLEAPNAQYRPRLETVLDVLSDAHGLGALEDVLSDLANAAPNRHHLKVAEFQLSGAGVITANFDTCIERAAEGPVDVVHFHGDVGPHGSLETLGARLRVIDRGFSQVVQKQLQETLSGSDGGTLAFIGYSGSDFFDVTPFLLAFLKQSAPRQIVWHKYASHSLTVREADANDDGEIISQAMGAGNRVLIAEGTLDELFDSLVDADVTQRAGAACVGATHPWEGRALPVEADRARATALLFGKLGYRSGTIDAFEGVVTLTASDHELMADAHWGRGEYREALTHWKAAYNGTGRDDRARRAEREGAILWITGRLVRAEVFLWRALMEYSACPNPVAPGVEAALLETYGRVISHMRRSPDSRYFVSEYRARFAEMRTRALAEVAQERLEQTASIGLNNVVAAYERLPDLELENSVNVFQEREALHGWLNYNHASLRARVEQHSDQGVPAASEYRLQAQRQWVLGAKADYMRTMILPGAAAHFSVKEFLRAQCGVQMSLWNRIRFVGGFCVSRILTSRV